MAPAASSLPALPRTMQPKPKVLSCFRSKTGMPGGRKYGVYLRLDTGRLLRIQWAASAADADAKVKARSARIKESNT